MLGSFSVAHVLSGGGVGNDADYAGSTSGLGDDVHVVIEDNKILTTLGGVEVDKLGNWLLRADEHLTDTGKPNLRAGVVAGERGLGEDFLGQLEVINAERLSTNDHPIETIKGVPWAELHLDVVKEGTEDGGSEVGSQELSVSLVLELSAEGSALIGNGESPIQIESGLVEHETTDLEEWAEEGLERKI